MIYKKVTTHCGNYYLITNWIRYAYDVMNCVKHNKNKDFDVKFSIVYVSMKGTCRQLCGILVPCVCIAFFAINLTILVFWMESEHWSFILTSAAVFPCQRIEASLEIKAKKSSLEIKKKTVHHYGAGRGELKKSFIKNDDSFLLTFQVAPRFPILYSTDIILQGV